MIVSPERNPQTWEQQLKTLLPLLGHRNWIVVADSAYPAQTAQGITTIATSADHLEVLAETLAPSLSPGMCVPMFIWMPSSGM